MSETLKNIVIVGGGTAGWLTAGLLAAEHCGREGREISVTLVESPDVRTVGVGEGTWPTMRSTLRRIGIAETEFLLECSAAFKQGTRFVGWVNGDDGEYYYHPFSAPAGYMDINLVPYWLANRNEGSFADAVSAQGQICDRGLAPKQASTPDYGAVANYAYHLDAGQFAALLQRHCTTRLGVRHVLDHVTQINGEPDGDIRSVSTRDHGELDGDLFVDCTGFGALLLGKHYGVPFVEKRSVLFNDRALAAQVPYAHADSPIASQTVSTARAAGWIWDIGLTTRRGVGYTYSSRHTSDDDAVGVLEAYIERYCDVPSGGIEPRRIAFEPGHRQKFWHRNCVAVGMSAGFLEPLEASALVLIELAGKMISEELPANRGVMDVVASRFNDKFLYRWDRIIDFLKLHYVLSKRTDSSYWIDNRRPDSIPPGLQELLHLWRHHAPGWQDFSHVDEVFSGASYQYVLCGMGFEAAYRLSARQAARAQEARELFIENARNTRRLVANLPENRQLLRHICRQGPTASDAA